MRVAAETHRGARRARDARGARVASALRPARASPRPRTRLVRIDPGYARASTASRLDAFLLPDSLHFAEYNAESPAGPGYTQRLCELFDATARSWRGSAQGRDVRFNRPIDAVLDALVASYREWGGTADPPTIAIVDWRDVPTWTEFEILRDAFIAARRARRSSAIRATSSFDERRADGRGERIDLVYRRVLINDILARPDECAALVEAYAARAVCVANTFRCKLAHKKAFFAVLTDERNAALFSDAERAIIARARPMDARRRRRRTRSRTAAGRPAASSPRRARDRSC